MMKVDLQKNREEQNDRVDPRVRVRFGALMQTGFQLTDSEINDLLKLKIDTESNGASLTDLIKKMVKEVAYGRAKLSLDEFKERFIEQNLAERIVSNFVNSLQEIDKAKETCENNVDAKKMFMAKQAVLYDVIDFLDKQKLTHSQTLYELVLRLKNEFPFINMKDIFLQEYMEVDDGKERVMTLKNKIVSFIEENLDKISADAYYEKFNNDKRGFVMGFMIGRVIKYDKEKRKITFNEKEFLNLVKYLDSIGYDIGSFGDSTLYDWLYYDSREMAKYVSMQKIDETRTVVHDNVFKVVQGIDETKASKLFFDKGFDVKAFHDKYIKKVLFDFYSNKQEEKATTIREIDLFYKLHDVRDFGRSNFTRHMIFYLKKLLHLRTSNKDLAIQKLKEIVGLRNNEESSSDDLDIQKHFEYFLNQTKLKFETILKDALFYRKDEEIHEACVYPGDILNCKDVMLLIEWVLKPSSFRRLKLNYASLELDKIRYMCAAFLYEFLSVMKEMSSYDFVDAEKKRNLLEQDIRSVLKINSVESVNVKFRLIQELDDKGKSFKKPVYNVAFNPIGIWDFLSNEDLALCDLFDSKEEIVKLNGKLYRLYGKETKIFQRVFMHIPKNLLHKENRDGTSGKISALVYSGDKRLIHLKSPITRLISKDRGKEVTDEYRWLISFSDVASKKAFRDFWFSYYPFGVIKNEDFTERRSFSNKSKISNTRLASTNNFKKHQEFVHTGLVPYRVNELVSADEDMFCTIDRVPLETQCQNLKDILVSNLSVYSPSSHAVYRAARSWNLLFNAYFPPEIFGDKYKELQDQGPFYGG